jgi:hypothetical protein
MEEEFRSAVMGRRTGARGPARPVGGIHSDFAARLRDELGALEFADQNETDGPRREPLFTRVARAKARWLRRVMYGSVTTSTEKCFAYAVAEHLNCVTLDAWPAQARLAQLLGFKSIKTIRRAASALEALDLLVIVCTAKHQVRYAPVFQAGDEDRGVRAAGQVRAAAKDTDVHESLLLIPINLSSPTKRTSDKRNCSTGTHRYRAGQRGAIEVQIAALLGEDGIDLLFKLGAIDDVIIERLCRAFAAGALGERELVAARLAAQQVRL